MADAQTLFDEAVQLARRGDHPHAIKLFEKVAGSKDPGWAARGSYELGNSQMKVGNLAAARAALERAACSGIPDWAAPAGVNLGLVLERLGDPVAAAAAYRRVIDAGHPRYSPQAAYNLGVNLKDRGEVDQARAAYQLAIRSGHTDWAPKSANNLGIMLMRARDFEGARAAFGYAVSSGHPEWSKAAERNLAVLAKAQSDPENAETYAGGTQRWWNGQLRTGEAIVLDVTVITPKVTTNVLAKNLALAVGRDDWSHEGVPHEITITSQRIRVDKLAFDYGQVVSYSFRHWQPVHDNAAYKVTYAARRHFSVTSKAGDRAEIEFADNYPRNADIWQQLRSAIATGARDRLVREFVAPLRAGNTKAWKNSVGALVLEVSKDGFRGAGHERQPWQSFQQHYDQADATLSVRSTADSGRGRLQVTIRAESLIPELLAACKAEFG